MARLLPIGRAAPSRLNSAQLRSLYIPLVVSRIDRYYVRLRPLWTTVSFWSEFPPPALRALYACDPPNAPEKATALSAVPSSIGSYAILGFLAAPPLYSTWRVYLYPRMSRHVDQVFWRTPSHSVVWRWASDVVFFGSPFHD